MTDNTWTNERRIAMSRDSSRIVLNFFSYLIKRKCKHLWSTIPPISNICGQLFNQYQTFVVNYSTNIKHLWSTIPPISNICGQLFHQYQQNEQLLLISNYWTQIRPRHMPMEIKVIAWTKQKHVADPGIKQINGITTLTHLIIGFQRQHRYEETI